MSEPKSILYDPELKKSMDYELLRKEGVAAAQEMSGEIWTDYNEHDPGVTILEQFCYALTDIAYRTNINIEQLLFSEEDYEKVSDNNALYAPSDIIPCGPITMIDYQILIIDKIKEVENAWVLKVRPSDIKQKVSGLFDVVLRVSNDISTDDYDNIAKKVRNLFAGDFRNLGEDLNEVRVLKPLSIEICLNIEITEDAVGEEVLAEIYYEINDYFNSYVRFYTYEELKDKKVNVFDIFETPSFEHGFINKDTLEPHKNKMLISQINEIISKLPGVRVVRELVVKKNGLKIYGDAVEIGDDFFVMLANLDSELRKSQDVVITKGNINYNYDPDLIAHLHEMKLAKEKRVYKIKRNFTQDRSVKDIDLKQLSKFSSIQNTLPGVYGVGRYGLPGDATQERIAQARQLQGYLYFFDQIMANHLAQVEKIKELFSIEVKSQGGTSYYGKFPVNLSGAEYLMDEPNDKTISDLLSQFDDFLVRKNKLLDHLLSRFAEKVNTHFENNSKILFGQLPANEIKQKILELKADLLKDYKLLSRDRSKAFGYGKAAWDIENVPTFQEKVYLMLNIADCRQRSLVDHYSKNELKSRRLDAEDVHHHPPEEEGGVGYKEVGVSDFKFTFLIKSKEAIQYLFTHGPREDNYHIVEEKDNGFVVLFQVGRNEEPFKVCRVRSVSEGNKAIEKLTKYFSEMNQKAEGFHIIEHILLRFLSLSKYGLKIYSQDKRVYFESTKSYDLSTWERIAEEVLMLAREPSNYKISPTEDGKYFLYITYDENVVLMRMNRTVESQEEAGNQVQKLVAHFRKLDQSDKSLNEKVTRIDSYQDQSSIDDNFFQTKISLVLPNWTPRFKSPEFLDLLHNMISENIPAHVGVNFVWMSKREMKTYESNYKKWLKARSKWHHEMTRMTEKKTDITEKKESQDDIKKIVESYVDTQKLDDLSATLIKLLTK